MTARTGNGTTGDPASGLSGKLALLLAALLPLLAACGGPARPAPVPVQPPEVVEEPDPAATDAPASPELEARAFPTPRPWLAPGVQWKPTPPAEGEALVLRLLQPRAGQPALDVEGEIAGHTVRFIPVPHGWFGIAALPIGTAGETELVLRYRLTRDSTVVDRVPIHVASTEFPSITLNVDPRYTRPPPEVLSRIREERELVRETLSRVSWEWLPREGFNWPRESRITSPFGQRRVFNDELRSRHTGLDLAGAPGDPVRAAGRGRVVLARDLYFAGKTVYLDHGLGVFTGYSHLSEILVEPGEVVERGGVVGRVGSTGRVTGPHLHWSLHVDGTSLNPSSLLVLEPEGDSPSGATVDP